MGTNVFFSYAYPDRTFAQAIARSLANDGFTVADPTTDIAPGDTWGDAVIAALRESDAVVLLISDQAADSAALMQELGAAHVLHKPIVPVRIGRSPLPTLLRNAQALEAEHLSPDQIGATLRTTLRDRLAA